MSDYKGEVYERWLNQTHGLELDPDINIGHRNNENGILYLAEYYMVLDQKGLIEESDAIQFLFIENRLRHLDQGVYNRGQGESREGHTYYETPENRRAISHDNITAVSCAAHILGIQDICKEIADHGLKNLFIYNNRKPKFDVPMNPGNWSVWLALGGYKLLALLFLPFYIINFMISTSKAAGETSSKKLYILELHCLKDTFGFGWLNRWLEMKMVTMYGPNYLHEIYKIYYRNEQHPLRVLTKE